jgi:hypothetical protein
MKAQGDLQHEMRSSETMENYGRMDFMVILGKDI